MKITRVIIILIILYLLGDSIFYFMTPKEIRRQWKYLIPGGGYIAYIEHGGGVEDFE